MEIYKIIFNRLQSFIKKENIERSDNYAIVFFLTETMRIFNKKIQKSQSKPDGINLQNVGYSNTIQIEADFAQRFNHLCDNYLKKHVGRNLTELRLMIMSNENNDEIAKNLKELCKKLFNITKTMIQN